MTAAGRCLPTVLPGSGLCYSPAAGHRARGAPRRPPRPAASTAPVPATAGGQSFGTHRA